MAVLIACLFYSFDFRHNNIDTFLHFGFSIDFSFSFASFAPFGPHVYWRCLVLRLPQPLLPVVVVVLLLLLQLSLRTINLHFRASSYTPTHTHTQHGRGQHTHTHARVRTHTDKVGNCDGVLILVAAYCYQIIINKSTRNALKRLYCICIYKVYQLLGTFSFAFPFSLFGIFCSTATHEFCCTVLSVYTDTYKMFIIYFVDYL